MCLMVGDVDPITVRSDEVLSMVAALRSEMIAESLEYLHCLSTEFREL